MKINRYLTQKHLVSFGVKFQLRRQTEFSKKTIIIYLLSCYVYEEKVNIFVQCTMMYDQ